MTAKIEEIQNMLAMFRPLSGLCLFRDNLNFAISFRTKATDSFESTMIAK